MRCCRAPCAMATRPSSPAGCARAATPCAAGRPTGHRRPAHARPGSCTATTTTWRPSAGGRRTRDKPIVTNHPRDAAELERRVSDGRGLLHADGASRANILSGDATHSLLTMSTVLSVRRKGQRIGHDYYTYFADPYNVARTMLLSFVDIARERRAATEQRRRGVHPRIHRDLKYALVRAWATVVQLHLQ